MQVPNDEDEAGGHGCGGVIAEGFGGFMAFSWIRSTSGVSTEIGDSFSFFDVRIVEAPAQEVLKGAW